VGASASESESESESLQISSHCCSGAGKPQVYLPFGNELMCPERLINGKGE